jgi:membrane protein YqaA with SNARE-associated domain
MVIGEVLGYVMDHFAKRQIDQEKSAEKHGQNMYRGEE